MLRIKMDKQEGMKREVTELIKWKRTATVLEMNSTLQDAQRRIHSDKNLIMDTKERQKVKRNENEIRKK
jgi:hypothetical protein